MSGAENPGAMPDGKTKRNDLRPTLEITERSPKELVASKNQVRKPKPKHVTRIVRSIERFGFSYPPLIHGDETVDGHARVLAARELGLEKIPCIDISHLTDDEVRLLRLALNKLQEQGSWDETALALEFAYHLEFNMDLSVTGFEAWEIDAALEIGATVSEEDPDDDFGPLLAPDATAVTRPSDLWRMHDSLALCSNA